MAGDGALFTREDAVEAAWAVVDPVLDRPPPRPPLRAGSWGPEGGRRADRGRRRLAQPRARAEPPRDAARDTTSSSCSTSTTRCSTTTASSPTCSAHLAARVRRRPSARPLLGDLRGSCAASSATPTTSARCSATAPRAERATRDAAADVALPDRLSVRRAASIPGALDAVEHLGTLGPTVILSDGDVVFQPRKVQRSGLLGRRRRPRADLHPQGAGCSTTCERRYPARHYVHGRRQAAHPGGDEERPGASA